ncbi:hypothetical protein ACFSOZ_26685 [Mesorhizobium newzealandense]|uniref:Uncharacterized protein n=1 Tax=Mesorhizobium newzealandense TaxID=1300302 RepID=A0ABW4UHR5_9HYPH
MRDSDLTERPGRGWTRWAEGIGEYDIDRTGWQAKVPHFPKLNVSVRFDWSDIVGIEHWGYREPKWCMRFPPADWQPMPAGYRQEAEQAWLRWHAATGGRQDAQGAPLLVGHGERRERSLARPLATKGGGLGV